MQLQIQPNIVFSLKLLQLLLPKLAKLSGLICQNLGWFSKGSEAELEACRHYQLICGRDAELNAELKFLEKWTDEVSSTQPST